MPAATLSISLPSAIIFDIRILLSQGTKKPFSKKQDHNNNNKKPLWHSSSSAVAATATPGAPLVIFSLFLLVRGNAILARQTILGHLVQQGRILLHWQLQPNLVGYPISQQRPMF